MTELTQARIKELLNYDELTGVFTWVVNRKGRYGKIGHIAGTLAMRGSIHIMVDGKKRLAHRLAWLYIYGIFPIDMIDHIDGNPINNKITNLRECNVSENGRNRLAQKNNTSGFKGVTWHKTRGKWRSSMMLNRKSIHIGHFDSANQASIAYEAYTKEIYREFYRSPNNGL